MTDANPFVLFLLAISVVGNLLLIKRLVRLERAMDVLLDSLLKAWKVEAETEVNDESE